MPTAAVGIAAAIGKLIRRSVTWLIKKKKKYAYG